MATLVGAISLSLAISVQAQQGQTAVGGSAAVASALRLIKFSGALKDGTGKPLSGVQGVTLALYKDQQGGTPLWMETQNVQIDEQGSYTVLLGATKSDGLPLELFTTNESRWLGVQASQSRDSDGAVLPEQPRVLLVSVPYALKAADADTVGGKPASAFALAPPSAGSPDTTPAGLTIVSGQPMVSRFDTATVSGSGTTNTLTKWLDTNGALGDSQVLDNGTNVGVGTGITTPVAKLQVQGATADSTTAALKVTDASGNAILYARDDARVALGTTDVTTRNSVLHVGGSAPAGADSSGVFVDAQATASANGQGLEGLYFSPLYNRNGFTGLQAFGIVSGFFQATGAGTIDQAIAGYFVAPTIGTNNYAVVGIGKNLFAGNTSDSSDYALQVLNAAFSPVLYARNDGHVGIGTASPSQPLDVVGNGNFSGNLTLGGNISANGTVGFGGLSTFTAPPSGSGVNQGSLYVNPATAGAGQTLLGVAVGGVQKLLVDSGGSITTAGSITAAGNIYLPNTTGSGAGVITLGGSRFLHNFGISNTFVGQNAGNFTMSGQSNVGVGNGALHSNTMARNNTAVGDGALALNTTALDNTAIGTFALNSNTTGPDNTATGDFALYFNTMGFGNTATGSLALFNNIAGSANTAGGSNALGGNTAGNQNTALGSGALNSNSSGSDNTAIGTNAGVTANLAYANVTGSNNTFLGYNSGPGISTQLINATAIGANAVVSQSNSLVLGSINGVNGAISGVNVGIGTATPTQALDVAGNVNASGNFAAGGSINSGAGMFTYGSGVRFLHKTGFANTFVGEVAGSLTITGVSNTGIGYNALYNETGGYLNTAAGASSLQGNTIGNGNTAIGANALLLNSTGSGNTALGVGTLESGNASNNTATGAGALSSNNADNNTAIGASALGDNNTGRNNTALGYAAGYAIYSAGSNVTGSNNTFIGYDAAPGLNGFTTPLNNATAIGANAVVAASNSLVLGSINGVNGATSSVNVGIGTATPAAALDINASAMILETAATPLTSSAACATGTIQWDVNYVYVCVATNIWKRSALSSF